MRAHFMGGQCNRRAFLLTTVAGLLSSRLSQAQPAVTRPLVSEQGCPLETMTPIAADGHRGLAVWRKPPGAGPFPAVVWLHEADARRKRVRRTALWIAAFAVLVYVGFIALVGLSK